ncbi:hypothetical protein OIV83_001712 [Microbotryomycetes sp. JL201]|nr:hypothetical protein OIV83_001712 [Microbotryomycetes sp. JL201]
MAAVQPAQITEDDLHLLRFVACQSEADATREQHRSQHQTVIASRFEAALRSKQELLDMLPSLATDYSRYYILATITLARYQFVSLDSLFNRARPAPFAFVLGAYVEAAIRLLNTHQYVDKNLLEIVQLVKPETNVVGGLAVAYLTLVKTPLAKACIFLALGWFVKSHKLVSPLKKFWLQHDLGWNSGTRSIDFLIAVQEHKPIRPPTVQMVELMGILDEFFHLFVGPQPFFNLTEHEQDQVKRIYTSLSVGNLRALEAFCNAAHGVAGTTAMTLHADKWLALTGARPSLESGSQPWEKLFAGVPKTGAYEFTVSLFLQSAQAVINNRPLIPEERNEYLNFENHTTLHEKAIRILCAALWIVQHDKQVLFDTVWFGTIKAINKRLKLPENHHEHWHTLSWERFGGKPPPNHAPTSAHALAHHHLPHQVPLSSRQRWIYQQDLTRGFGLGLGV